MYCGCWSLFPNFLCFPTNDGYPRSARFFERDYRGYCLLIFVDLNNNKKALSYVTLTCLKPDLEPKKTARLLVALGESVEDVDISKAYYTAGMKVCQKYAYRDSLVFAYREAKESDDSK